MDGLPIDLQALIYGEAGVYGVCSLARSEVLRTVLLADQRNINAPLGANRDCPPTWRIAAMAGRTPDLTEAQLGAALQRLGHRLGRLQHLRIHLGGAGHDSQTGAHGQPRFVIPGLLRFVQHVVPALGNATRLTLRGHQPALPTHCAALPWQLLSRSRLGAACTRLDVTSDDLTIALLLNGLATSFPSVREVRVQCRPHEFTAPLSSGVATLRAPDSLTSLTVLLRPDNWPAKALNHLCLKEAAGLEKLRCRVAAEDGSVRRGTIEVDCILPALHTIAGNSYLVTDEEGGLLPALRRVDTTLCLQHGRGLCVPRIQAWLLLNRPTTPHLAQLRLWVVGLEVSSEDRAKLQAWACVALPFEVTLM